MKNIMFVCHGNICRSPMAEFIFKEMLEKKNLSHEFMVSSSATSTEEIWNGVGNPVYPPAQKELAIHGISCNGKRAVQIKAEDYEFYDMIIVMDDNNIRNLKRIIGQDTKGKVWKLLDFSSYNTGKVRHLEGRNISDPWYTGDFRTTYNDILEGCEGLLKFISMAK
jgi:Protein-tyrosine-phosphatase